MNAVFWERYSCCTQSPTQDPRAVVVPCKGWAPRLPTMFNGCWDEEGTQAVNGCGGWGVTNIHGCGEITFLSGVGTAKLSLLRRVPTLFKLTQAHAEGHKKERRGNGWETRFSRGEKRGEWEEGGS